MKKMHQVLWLLFQTSEDDDEVAADYDDYENDQKEDFKTKVP